MDLTENVHKTLGDGTKTTKLLTVCFSDLQHLSRCCLILEQIQASVQIHFRLARIQLCVLFLPSFSVFCWFFSPVFLLAVVFFSPLEWVSMNKRWERSSCVLEGLLCTDHVTLLASKPLNQCRTQPVEAGCSQAGLGQARPGRSSAGGLVFPLGSPLLGYMVRGSFVCC